MFHQIISRGINPPRAAALGNALWDETERRRNDYDVCEKNNVRTEARYVDSIYTSGDPPCS
jgi:hypothetical protein